MAEQPIQSVWINHRKDIDFYCPACGTVLVRVEPDDSTATFHCEHTLFIGTDGGWEYKSPQFDACMVGVLDEDGEELDPDDPGSFSDNLSLNNSVKFTLNLSDDGHPISMGGLYIGIRFDGQ